MIIENPILYQFQCFKKGKKENKHYNAIVQQDFVHLYQVWIEQNKQDEQQKSKYSLPIKLQTHIKWEVQEVIEDNKKHYKLVSFKFQQVKNVNDSHVAKITTFFGEEPELLLFKEALRNKIIFQRIQDFYTPLQTLGKGASSRVLLVRHKNTEQYFAAKCVDKAYVNETENGIDSMFQEIAINNALDHPSFIKLHAVYEGDNTFYMVMDLLEGKSLHDELNNHKSGFPEEIVRQIMIQILQGLEYMHSKNIMHRDLKPENIMLQKKGDLNSLKIVDFGLATYTNIDKYLFPKCGTPGYVAPEIANLIDKSLKYDKVCDIFSAGVIFFKLLTGKDLFPGVGFNLVLKLNKQCKIDLTPLQMKKLDQNLITLITKMLEKDPVKRITATECLADSFFFNEQRIKPTPDQKKLFFQSLKQKNFTTEFGGEQFKSSPKEDVQVDKGSFFTQDCAYQGMNVSTQQQKMMKFNTTEFDHVDMQNMQQQKMAKFVKPDQIEEEDEK